MPCRVRTSDFQAGLLDGALRNLLQHELIGQNKAQKLLAADRRTLLPFWLQCLIALKSEPLSDHWEFLSYAGTCAAPGVTVIAGSRQRQD